MINKEISKNTLLSYEFNNVKVLLDHYFVKSIDFQRHIYNKHFSCCDRFLSPNLFICKAYFPK